MTSGDKVPEKELLEERRFANWLQSEEWNWRSLGRAEADDLDIGWTLGCKRRNVSQNGEKWFNVG